MKISKLTEAKTLTEVDVSTVDPSKASTAQIKDAVEDAVEQAGATITPTEAEKTAQDISFVSKRINAEQAAPLNVQNKVTKLLDRCLRTALNADSGASSNLLVIGLPGSGKTAIVENWCKSKTVEGQQVKLVYIDAKNRDLPAAISGVMLRDTRVENPAVSMADSKFLDRLDEAPCVLFLDELNRAKADLRGSLLDLINSHRVQGTGTTSYRYFDKLLFTVACINPDCLSDEGADKLNAAELSRFDLQTDYDSNPEDALSFFKAYYDSKLARLDKNDPNYRQRYTALYRKQALALALVGDAKIGFKFDGRDIYQQIMRDQKNMLNQRQLTKMIDASDGTKEDFLLSVDSANLLKKDVDMINEILADYTDPTPKFETAADAKTLDPDEISDEDLLKGVEDDEEMFSATPTTVTAQQVKAELDDFAKEYGL